MKNLLLLLTAICGLSSLTACGGGASGAGQHGGGGGPALAPTVSMSATFLSITVGQSTMINWSTTNATSCTASATPAANDWTGPEPTSGSISVTPTAAGTFIYMLMCTGAGGSAPGSVSVVASVPANIAITSGPLPAGTDGKLYGTLHNVLGTGGARLKGVFFALTESGGAGNPTWSWAAAPGSSLPPGLTCCDLALGMQFPPIRALVRNAIAGVPTQPGNFSVIVSVSLSGPPAGQASMAYVVTIDPPSPPTINSASPAIGTLNSPYPGFTFSASGGLPPFTWTETGALPKGLELGIGGMLSGTPTAAGSFPIVVTAKDSSNQDSPPQNFTIQVLAQGFTPTGTMAADRVWHTATLLNDGKVLVSGGINRADFPATAELYDPTSGKFAATTGNPTTPRFSAVATVLKSGKVLIAGGKGTNSELATADVYDPTSESFATATTAMSTTRAYHTATLLNDGTVLVTGGLNDAGGASGTPVASAEIYDPNSNSFTLTGSMTTGRFLHTATLLSNGDVLITGGLNETGALATAEIYDPLAKTFTATGTMTLPRMGHTATLLGNNKVLLAGGASSFGGDATNSAEIFDPVAGTFTATNPMTNAHSAHSATLLQNGQVLVAGGASVFYGRGPVSSISSVELFDPTTGNFTLTADMTSVRESQTATLLKNGEVLVTCGSNGTLGYSATTSVLATAELYQ
jgi:hypothetical protein